MDKGTVIKNNIRASIALKEKLFQDNNSIDRLIQLVDKTIETYQNGGKVLFCGNGGSAADAQHLSAELAGRYYYDRLPLHAEALHVNSSFLTAVANDYSYDDVYARLIQAVGNPDDILIGLSTSGNSANVVNAFIAAKEKACFTVAFTGQGGGKLKEHADLCIEIDSTDTPRIQECHMHLGHTFCELVEQALFPKG